MSLVVYIGQIDVYTKNYIEVKASIEYPSPIDNRVKNRVCRGSSLGQNS